MDRGGLASGTPRQARRSPAWNFPPPGRNPCRFRSSSARTAGGWRPRSTPVVCSTPPRSAGASSCSGTRPRASSCDWAMRWGPGPSVADGSRIAGVYGGQYSDATSAEVGLWDLATGRQVLLLKGHGLNTARMANSVAFSPDAGRIVSAAARSDVVEVGPSQVEIRSWDATPVSGPARQQSSVLPLSGQVWPGSVDVDR